MKNIEIEKLVDAEVFSTKYAYKIDLQNNPELLPLFTKEAGIWDKFKGYAGGIKNFFNSAGNRIVQKAHDFMSPAEVAESLTGAMKNVGRANTKQQAYTDSLANIEKAEKAKSRAAGRYKKTLQSPMDPNKEYNTRFSSEDAKNLKKMTEQYNTAYSGEKQKYDDLLESNIKNVQSGNNAGTQDVFFDALSGSNRASQLTDPFEKANYTRALGEMGKMTSGATVGGLGGAALGFISPEDDETSLTGRINSALRTGVTGAIAGGSLGAYRANRNIRSLDPSVLRSGFTRGNPFRQSESTLALEKQVDALRSQRQRAEYRKGLAKQYNEALVNTKKLRRDEYFDARKQLEKSRQDSATAKRDADIEVNNNALEREDFMKANVEEAKRLNATYRERDLKVLEKFELNESSRAWDNLKAEYGKVLMPQGESIIAIDTLSKGTRKLLNSIGSDGPKAVDEAKIRDLLTQVSNPVDTDLLNAMLAHIQKTK